MDNLDKRLINILKSKFTLDLLDLYQKRIGFTKLQYTILKHYYILQDMSYDDIADDYGCDRRTVERAVVSIKNKFKTAMKSKKYIDEDSIELLCELCEFKV